MFKIWRKLAVIYLLYTSVGNAQTWNAGLSVTNSRGLGFDKYYGGGIMEVTFNTKEVIVRSAIEILDAEKKDQSGYGGRLDLSIIRPLTERIGVIGFYRPSFINQTDYDKTAHEFGLGLVFVTKGNEAITVSYSAATDSYQQQTVGIELRAGKGHWWRSRYEYVSLTQPVTNKHLTGGKIVVAIAPRLRW